MLLLSTSSYNKLIMEAIEKYPAECCGFLLGRENNGQRWVSEVRISNNNSSKQKEFAISPEDYKMAEKDAKKRKLSLLGIYHSHPDWDAIPSETDIKYALPNFSYVIISVFKHKVSSARSWRLNDNRMFEEEPIISDQNSSLPKNNTAHGNHHHSHTAP